MSENQTCVLCGYPSAEYVVYAVPLASPPQDLIVCLDCVEDLQSLAQEKRRKSEDSGCP